MPPGLVLLHQDLRIPRALLDLPHRASGVSVGAYFHLYFPCKLELEVCERSDGYG